MTFEQLVRAIRRAAGAGSPIVHIKRIAMAFALGAAGSREPLRVNGCGQASDRPGLAFAAAQAPD
jgi:hypothetical protein